jgi:hypothetical protein
MAQRRAHLIVSIQSPERPHQSALEHRVLEFDFADPPSALSDGSAQGLKRRAIRLKEKIALWLERKL